jgi:hypothetical protein
MYCAVTFSSLSSLREQKGRTPEEVAEDARRYDVTEYLKKQRQDAAGQFAYKDEKCNANIWIGDQVGWQIDAP